MALVFPTTDPQPQAKRLQAGVLDKVIRQRLA
jgi:hypothetical protein